MEKQIATWFLILALTGGLTYFFKLVLWVITSLFDPFEWEFIYRLFAEKIVMPDKYVKRLESINGETRRQIAFEEIADEMGLGEKQKMTYVKKEKTIYIYK